MSKYWWYHLSLLPAMITTSIYSMKILYRVVSLLCGTGFTFCVLQLVLPVNHWTFLFVPHISWLHCHSPCVIFRMFFSGMISCDSRYVGHPVSACTDRMELAVTPSCGLPHLRRIFCLHFILLFVSHQRLISQVLVPSYIFCSPIWQSGSTL